MDLLIPKFSGLGKRSGLTPERLQKMIVGRAMTLQEKKLLTEMLYNREAAIAWDFTEIGKVYSEVAQPQKIQKIDHQTWQVPGFLIPPALSLVIIDISQDRLKMDILEPCHGLY